MESELYKRIENKGMIISRMPDWAKDTIKQVSNDEFSDDYGLCIAQFVKDAIEYRRLKEKILTNGFTIINNFNNENKQDGGKNEQNK